MNKVLSLLFIIFFVQINSQNYNRLFKNAEFSSGNNLKIEVIDGYYNIIFYNNNIVETSFVPLGENGNKKSHTVKIQPEIKVVNFQETENNLMLISDGITVLVSKDPFQIKYYFKDKLLISENIGYDKNDSLETIDFNIKSNEILYGGGARALGMNRRGNRLRLYNKANYGYETRSELMNYTMPLVVSSEKYMLHFDNAPIGFLDLDSSQNNRLRYETISGRKTYQLVVAETWAELMNQYTFLTGKQPMPPRWSLGNFASRFGYHSQEEVENTIKKFKDFKIPIDAVVLDLYWFGKTITGTMGNLEVDKDSFPDFEGMIYRLKSKGVKTITITEPFILTTSNKWSEAVENQVLATDSIGNPYTYDFYFGNTGLIDIYNPKGSSWFWSKYKDLRLKGVVGVWGDLGEPEVHPSQLSHYNASADEVHNIYGHDWAGLIYKGYKIDFPNERPFILMRAGYSGSQRYGLIPWSGDVNRTWGGLQSQPEIALQMGLQGLAYMHSDLGGFAGNNLDDELYVRWLQYGVFQPIFRPHAQEEVPSEPVFRSDKALKLSKKAIELRYSMLPYNYHLIFENNTTGLPLMRPLFFDDSESKYDTISSTYLWGNDFLISPIIKADQAFQKVHFPSTSNWYDFYTKEFHQGGKEEFIKTQEDYIPTFVRAGAIIPMVDDILTTDNYKLNSLQLHYFYDFNVKGTSRLIYNDDGLLSNAYEKGYYELLQINSKLSSNNISMNLICELGNNQRSCNKNIELFIYNFNKRPKKVILNGKEIHYNYNSSKTLKINFNWETATISELLIKF